MPPSTPSTKDVYVSTAAVRASHAADWACLTHPPRSLLAFASHKRAAIIDTDSPAPAKLLPALAAKINVLKFHAHPSGRPDANPLIVCGLDDSSVAIYSSDQGGEWKVAVTLKHPDVEPARARSGAAGARLPLPAAAASSSATSTGQASVQALGVVRPSSSSSSGASQASEASSNLLVSGHIDGTLCLWSLRQDAATEGGISAKLERQAALVNVPGSSKAKGSALPMDAALTRLPGAKEETWIAAVGSTDSRISLWTIDGANEFSLNPVLAITGHSDWVRSLDFVRPSERSQKLLLASGSQDHSIRLWALTPSNGEGAPAEAVANDNVEGADDFDRLASRVEAQASERDELDTAAKEFSVGRKGDGDGERKTWAVRLEALLSAHDSWVNGVRWAPRIGGMQPAALLSASSDNSVILWTPVGVPGLSRSLPAFSASSDSIEGNDGQGPGIWIPSHRFGELGIVGSVAHGMMGALWRPSASNEDQDAASSIYAHGWNGALHLWSREEQGDGWQTRAALTGHYKAARSVRWEPEGRYFLSAGADRTSRIHALCTRRDGQPLSTPEWHEVARPQTHGHDVQSVAWVNRVAFVSAAEEKVVRAFEAPTNFVESIKALGALEVRGRSATEGTAYDVLAFNLPSLAHLRSPEHLAGPIKRAAQVAASESKARKLVLLAVSNAFNGCHNDATRAPQLSFEDAESFLKWAYAQAWKVAIDESKLLMEVDVLFVPDDAAEAIVKEWTEDERCARFWTVEEPSASLPFLSSLSSGPSPQSLPSSGPARPANGVVPLAAPFPQHRCIALGGTFDHLHVGHKILLSVSALMATERIVIGVTDDKMLAKKKNAQLLEDLPTRLARVEGFIRRFKSSLTPLQRHDVVQLSDVCGPAGTDPDIQGLVVTDETIAGADMIDAERIKNGLGPLQRHVIGVIGSGGETDVKGKDAAELAATKVGSTAIRAWLAENGGERAQEDTLNLDVNKALRTTNTDTPIGASVPPLALSNRGIFPDQQTPSSAPSQGDAGSASTAQQGASSAAAPASNTTAVFRRPPTEESLHVSSVWAELHKVYGPPLELLCVDVSDDATWLASSCQGKTEAHSAVHLHDVRARWAERQVLRGHTLGVERVRFSPRGGAFLVTASRDRSWRLYRRRDEGEDEAQGEPWSLIAKETKAHARIVYDVAWAPASKGSAEKKRSFVTASRDKTIKGWAFFDPRSATKEGGAAGSGSEVEVRQEWSLKLEAGATSLAFSERGSLAVGLEDGSLLLFDARASQGQSEPRLVKRIEKHHTEAVSQMEWRPAKAEEDQLAQTLLSAGEDGVVRLLTVEL